MNSRCRSIAQIVQCRFQPDSPLVEIDQQALGDDHPNVAIRLNNLALIYDRLGEGERAGEHRALHARYKVDDNARDRAIALARIADPAADHAAEPVVIYDLQRAGAYGLSRDDARIAGP